MGKSKSQWDFGELFSPEQTRRVLSVSELTTQIRRLLEQQVGEVWVSGEVTNFRLQSSGHIYFTLKDANAQLPCVLFRDVAGENRGLVRDGQKVVLRGDLTVYEPRGQYQLRVLAVELQGVGALQLAFERLKQKLQAEGLFASERKRPIPRYPQRIGLVTSPTGAAIRDVLHGIRRRQPGLELILAPCRVQGAGAAEEIAGAIRLLNDLQALRGAQGDPRSAMDLILVTRGGGSLEDLWAFNEEIVARAIFESALPVVSAVGHEIDFTISDFVADLRAATPSAAAELITEGAFASRRFIAEAPAHLRQLVEELLEQHQERVGQLRQRLRRMHPRRQLNEKLQYLDDLQIALARCAKAGLRHERGAWQNLVLRFSMVQPAKILSRQRQTLHDLERRLGEQRRLQVKARKSLVANAESRLRLLSPLYVLERGYSITSDAASGKVVREANEVQAGQRLKTRLKSGELHSVVEG